MDRPAPDPPMGRTTCPRCHALVERGWDRCRICGAGLTGETPLGLSPSDRPPADRGLLVAVVAVFALAAAVGWWALTGRADDDVPEVAPTSTAPVREGGESRSEAAAALLVAELDARGVDAEEGCVASVAVRPGYDAALTEALDRGTVSGGPGRELLMAVADECVGRAAFVVAMARSELGLSEEAAACVGEAAMRDLSLARAFMRLPVADPSIETLGRMAPCLSADERARLGGG